MRKGFTPGVQLTRAREDCGHTGPRIKAKRLTRGYFGGNDCVLYLFDLYCGVDQHCTLEEIETDDLAG